MMHAARIEVGLNNSVMAEIQIHMFCINVTLFDATFYIQKIQSDITKYLK